jgi:hypothetical protein
LLTDREIGEICFDIHLSHETSDILDFIFHHPSSGCDLFLKIKITILKQNKNKEIKAINWLK